MSNDATRENESTKTTTADTATPEHDESKGSQVARAWSEDDASRGTENDDQQDPFWWTPHAVLTFVIVVGVLGFFGLFNRPTKEEPFASASSTGASTLTSVGAQHLLVMHKESMRVPPGITRTKDEAKKRAEEALVKVKGGADFNEIVKQYSDEPGAGQRAPAGDLGVFEKGQMVPGFEQAAFAIKKPGEFSGIAETPFGFHIIKRTK